MTPINLFIFKIVVMQGMAFVLGMIYERILEKIRREYEDDQNS